MLWTIAVILFVLWALGLATAYTLSGFVHILLVVAIVIVLIQVLQGRRVV
jgi:hypothetical protein